MMITTSRRLIRQALEHTSAGSSYLFRRSLGVTGPHGYPDAPWANAVLKTRDEVDRSIDQVRQLGLPVMKRPNKNWDSLAALDLILKRTNRNARIFDAGGESYSVILPWLALYGYRNLVCGNITFQTTFKWGPIVYEHVDITKTSYPDSFYDAITCLSVVEHGVDLKLYFREMSRILKLGGMLITSTDYYETPIDTRGQVAFGAPIRIFTAPQIRDAIAYAIEVGFKPLSPLDLTTNEKVIHWRDFDLRYTFLIFSLQKTANST
jgi:hypothetical protein